MAKLLEHHDVSTVILYQCEYGLVIPGPDGAPVPAKKPTQWASNFSWMLKRLSKRCSKTHGHQSLAGGSAKHAELYPLNLIVEIRRGTRDTIDDREKVYVADGAAISLASVLNS